jgi:hypothetical protein
MRGDLVVGEVHVSDTAQNDRLWCAWTVSNEPRHHLYEVTVVAPSDSVVRDLRYGKAVIVHSFMRLFHEEKAAREWIASQFLLRSGDYSAAAQRVLSELGEA